MKETILFFIIGDERMGKSDDQLDLLRQENEAAKADLEEQKNNAFKKRLELFRVGASFKSSRPGDSNGL